MKALVSLLFFCSLATALKAGDPYRSYLLATLYPLHSIVQPHIAETSPSLSPSAFIPRFERPRGAIFCRMEDKVTKATKVWLKLGVQ